VSDVYSAVSRDFRSTRQVSFVLYNTPNGLYFNIHPMVFSLVFPFVKVGRHLQQLIAINGISFTTLTPLPVSIYTHLSARLPPLVNVR
jgi:hypothetical protein